MSSKIQTEQFTELFVCAHWYANILVTEQKGIIAYIFNMQYLTFIDNQMAFKNFYLRIL